MKMRDVCMIHVSRVSAAITNDRFARNLHRSTYRTAAGNSAVAGRATHGGVESDTAPSTHCGMNTCAAAATGPGVRV
jgi:hypothetical protein